MESRRCNELGIKEGLHHWAHSRVRGRCPVTRVRMQHENGIHCSVYDGAPETSHPYTPIPYPQVRAYSQRHRTLMAPLSSVMSKVARNAVLGFMPMVR